MTTNEPLLTNPEGIERWLEVPFPPSPDACRAAFHDARMAHVLKAANEAALVALEATEKRATEYLSNLESVNQIARDYGYGQGEIDGDLAGCIRAIIDRATKAAQEGRNEL